MTDETDGEEFTREYLKDRFLSSAVRAISAARHKAGLTQEDIAQRLGKKQAAIARWESDTEGRMSLRQYVELALACGKIPLNMMLEPVESVRDFVIDHPEALQTPSLYIEWLKKRSEPVPVSSPMLLQISTTQSESSGAPRTTILRSNQESTPTANSAERFVKEQYQKLLSQALGQSHDESITNTIGLPQTSTLAQSALGRGQEVAA